MYRAVVERCLPGAQRLSSLFSNKFPELRKPLACSLALFTSIFHHHHHFTKAEHYKLCFCLSQVVSTNFCPKTNARLALYLNLVLLRMFYVHTPTQVYKSRSYHFLLALGAGMDGWMVGMVLRPTVFACLPHLFLSTYDWRPDVCVCLLLLFLLCPCFSSCRSSSFCCMQHSKRKRIK